MVDISRERVSPEVESRLQALEEQGETILALRHPPGAPQEITALLGGGPVGKERGIRVGGKPEEIGMRTGGFFAEREALTPSLGRARGEAEVAAAERQVRTIQQAEERFRGEAIPERVTPIAETRIKTTAPEPSLFEKTVAAFEKAEEKARPVAKKVVSEEPAGGLRPFGLTGLAASKLFPKAQETALSFEAGVREEVREKPIKTGALFVAGAALGGVGSLVGKAGTALGIGKIATALPGPTKFVSRAVAFGIPAFVIEKGTKRVKAEEGLQARAKEAGKVSVEVGSLIGGGVVGVKTIPKAKGFIRTVGKKKIPAEKLVAPEVLTGQKRFPLAGKGLSAAQRQKLQLKLFKESKFTPTPLKGSFPHATAADFKKAFVVEPGTSEFPGLFVSGKGVSPHFLRVTKQETALLGEKVFPQFSTPTIAFIKPTAVRPLPPGLKPFQPEKFLKVTEKGVAFVPGLKTEVEAVIPAGTALKPTGKEFATTFKGIRVPIRQFEVTTPPPTPKEKLIGTLRGVFVSKKGFKSILAPSTTRFVSQPSSLGITTKFPAVTPLSAATLLISKPSKVAPSTKIGLPSSIVKPSKISPVKPSKLVSTPKKLAPSSISLPPSKPASSIIGSPSKPPISPPISPPSRTPPSRPPSRPPISPPSSSIIGPPSKPRTTPFLIPSIKFPSIRKKPKKKPGLLRKAKTIFKPSLVGLFGKAKAFKPGKLTGLEVRPLLKRKKTRGGRLF